MKNRIYLYGIISALATAGAPLAAWADGPVIKATADGRRPDLTLDGGLRDGQLSLGARARFAVSRDYPIYTQSVVAYLLPEESGFVTLHDFRVEQRGGLRLTVLPGLQVDGSIGLGASYLYAHISDGNSSVVVGSEFSALVSANVASTYTIADTVQIGAETGLAYLSGPGDLQFNLLVLAGLVL